MTPGLRLNQHNSILELDALSWNQLAGDSPFLRHEFLAALEKTGCVDGKTAWQSRHLTVTDHADKLLGALPLYIKYNSLGEYVFDWSWSDSYDTAGLPYYPKLVSAVPFTPTTGHRFLVASELNFSSVVPVLLSGARELADKLNASSLHVLFPTEHERSYLDSKGMMARKGCQFHWHNRGYSHFDDFLSCFTSAKRKKVRRERKRVAEADIQFERMHGNQLSADDWETVFSFYARTFYRRGRAPYLNHAFFTEIAQTMPENLLIILARYGGHPIAAAICFCNQHTLYGRYWGCLADFHSLHFECCYYQGINYCIEEKIQTFEPGTQGEHKISRGFIPTATWSNHWLTNQEFSDAVANFLRRERLHIDVYIAETASHTPYRNDLPLSLPPR